MPARKPHIRATTTRLPLRTVKLQVAMESPPACEEAEQLRQKLAALSIELESLRTKQKWLEAALEAQRHARQMLEATVSATYTETVFRVRDIVRATVPHDATVLVISKGDDELLNLDGRRAWHFPQDENGDYAGHHPADSTTAIDHLKRLVDRGGQFLLLPNTAFWWLEHYREFQEHLDRFHLRIWRDDRCVLYRLHRDAAAKPRLKVNTLTSAAGPAAGLRMQPASASLPDIVCFPIINWDYRFQRPQQLMRQFAVAGHRVLYLAHEFRKAGEPYRFRPLGENLYEVSLRGSRFKVRDSVLDRYTRETISASLATMQKDCSPGVMVAMIQSAFWWPVVKAWAAMSDWPVIYDCMDHHAGFATSNPVVVEQEKELLACADLVVASSARLEAAARKLNRNVLLLRNACDYDHFGKIPPKTRATPPVIGYYGAIAEWFDTDLVIKLAERRPDWNFILVGSTVGADTHRLAQLPNVSLPGEKPYAEIPTWLARFDVTILPFKHNPLTEATNPVKVYEIFASGRPLISSPLPEMRLFAPLARLASTVSEFEREIEFELNHPNVELESKRRAFARGNTWQQRFETLSNAIRAVVVEKGKPKSRRSKPPRQRETNRSVI